jgi:hypothetical protein
MSQTTDHNKILGIIHLAYGAFNVLVLIVITLFMVGVMGLVATGQSGGEAIPIGIFGFLMAIVILLNLVFTAPEFVTGYALLKRKRWARVAGIIAAIIESLNFPFGTALCVYTLWFLFSDKGKLLYDKTSSALPPSPRQWQQFHQREVQYVPPSAPPDWR